MKKLLLLAAFVAALLFGGVSSASAAGQVCYDVNVAVSGQAPVAAADCVALP